jgi:hypothetical protein
MLSYYCCTRTVDILRSSFDIEQQISCSQLENSRATISSDRGLDLILQQGVKYVEFKMKIQER